MELIKTIIAELRRIRFRFRVALFGAGLAWLFIQLLPDLFYDISFSKAKVFTIEELAGMKVSDIPRYLVVKDAQPIRSNYVEAKNASGRDVTTIAYPIYSNEAILNRSLVCHLVIVDRRAKQKDLDDGNYFGSPAFFIGGRFKGLFMDTAKRYAFESNGISIASDCIELDKGSTPMSAAVCILCGILDLVLMGIVGASILPGGSAPYKLF